MIVSHLLRYVFEPGFFGSGEVQVAFAVGTIVAVTSAVVGVFTVTRGQSFAGHSLGDISTTGGSGAFLLGVSQFWGYLVLGAAAAAFMELVGVQRRRGRDVATGIVLGAVLGVSALLLYFDTTHTSTTGATVTVLFGSIFAVASSSVPAMAGLAAAGVAAVLVLYRPLLLSSLHPELASVRGVPVRTVALGFLVLMGVTVSLTSMVVGTILSPALLVGPAACALRLSRRPGPAMALAAAIGLVATWAGIVLAYASATWPPSHAGWPVSFFVVALVFVAYLGVEAGAALRR